MSQQDRLHQGLTAIFQALIDTSKAEVNDHHGAALNVMRAQLPLRNKTELSSLVRRVESTLADLVIAAHPEIPAVNAQSFAFLYLHYNFLERLLRNVVEVQEGSCCCADKTRWLLNAYEAYLVHGTLPDMTVGEKVFWKPRFGSAAQWILLIEGIEHLHYGAPTKYLASLQALLTTPQEYPPEEGDRP